MPGEAARPSDPIRVLILDEHPYKALRSSGIETVQELTSLSREMLLLIQGIGPAYADAIEAELALHNLKLRTD
jgi:DNA-directed RNA polymerase alpha subunit